jgi:TRAP-type C4-dicarboxylate transport system permease small subunit
VTVGVSGAPPPPYGPHHRLVGVPTAALALAGGGLVLALGLLVTASVARRWLTTSPIPGDFELVQTGLAVAVFAFLPWCHWRRGNIVVDSFTTRLPARLKGAIDAFWSLVYALVAVVLAWRLAAGGLDLLAAGQTTMVLALPVGWAVLACAALAGWLAVAALATAAAQAGGDGS